MPVAVHVIGKLADDKLFCHKSTLRPMNPICGKSKAEESSRCVVEDRSERGNRQVAELIIADGEIGAEGERA